ncbi:hypothetical protein QUF84_21015 [Fictibacillus enclensis]|uniref:hypothetical protein n=1 Tax=Fictibacillus enclensis TaxID=1017270 RepID=UPI0025A09C2A|nr:hypothetical protein [Fictibacillus enclensis]MDM5339684.1 hypothetical protein [Fictibacillus enclensis]
MDHLITQSELEKLQFSSRGNPSKLAVYSAAMREYRVQLNDHFNEEHPFNKTFSESHLEDLRAFAEDNPDDESAQARYAIQKDRYETKEANKTAHIDRRLLQSELKNKIAAGEVTKTDLERAALLAKTNGSDDNKVLYATIKKLLGEKCNENA